MAADLFPKTNADVLAAVQWAVAEKTPLEIIGNGSKRALGRPMQTAHTLDLSGLSGVTLFEPDELVLSAKAGTPLSEIEAQLDEHHQELQFEPMDVGPLLGLPEGQATLGGLVNTNLSGPRRLKAGSVRDHILGIKAVSGRGEEFKSGGRVVKNVTGYDLSKGICGAYGTLAVLTDITMKVLPRAETEQTLVLTGLSDVQATEAMALAMGSSAEVSGAAHIPADGDTPAQTFLRLEGFAPSVAYRIDKLSTLLATVSSQERIDNAVSKAIWKDMRDCRRFAGSKRPVWRISCTPTQGHMIAAAISQKAPVRHMFDWQGGLIWVEVDDVFAYADAVRGAIAAHGGGHATLIRADADIRLTVDVFQPQEPALAQLSERYRANFDPYSILNPGRMRNPR